MQKFLHDAIDLALLRVKPLDRYVYDWRIPIIWLTLVSAVLSLFGNAINAGPMPRMLFAICATWVQTLLATLFLGWWQRLDKRCTQKGSLFPLLVLLGSIRVLYPLVLALPSALVAPASILLVVYSFVILVKGLAGATGAGVLHTIAGLLAYLPTLLILALIATQLMVNWGWIDVKMLDQRAQNLQQVQPDKGAAPDLKNNTTKPTESGQEKR